MISTGGTINVVVEPPYTWQSHAFTSDGTFTVTEPGFAYTLVVGAGGGGGGSSYTDPSCTGVVHTQGYRTGSGQVTISW